ncbi:MAG: alginate lyase family protein [Bacteroidetes bacterium]|nr:alginate lyase family protein [Bacteroidota bacterium]
MNRRTLNIALLLVMVTAVVLAQRPRVYLLNADTLVSVQSAVFKRDARYVPAVKKLRKDADKAMKAEIVTVIEKTILPPSGNKNDFFSLSRYWWPDPSKPDGLPYIRKDGETNPEVLTIPDHENLMTFFKTVHLLSIAYYYTGDEQYAVRAAEWIRIRLITPETRMNPHLRFSQQVRGVDKERGTGILDGREFSSTIDAIGILRLSRSLTPADNQAIDRWFLEYYHWLTESPNGKSESNARNNHGTWYDVHTSAVALFVGKKETARRIAEEAKEKRIAYQFSPDGEQAEELARTLSWHYCQFNLTALFRLATLARHAGVDLFNYSTQDGRSIRKGLDYLIPFAYKEKEWKAVQLKEFNYDMLAQLSRQAAVEYRDQKYLSVWKKFTPSDPQSDRGNLLYGILAE